MVIIETGCSSHTIDTVCNRRCITNFGAHAAALNLYVLTTISSIYCYISMFKIADNFFFLSTQKRCFTQDSSCKLLSTSLFVWTTMWNRRSYSLLYTVEEMCFGLIGGCIELRKKNSAKQINQRFLSSISAEWWETMSGDFYEEHCERDSYSHAKESKYAA